MTRYFKPRKDLKFSGCLLPQKIENAILYRWESYYCQPPHWRKTGKLDDRQIEPLLLNFIEVLTEEEATA